MRQHMNYEELEASRILSMKNLDALKRGVFL